MAKSPSDVPRELGKYGAIPSQIVDVDRDDNARILPYLDLRAEAADWRRPVVVENNGRPCVHVFDGRQGVSPETVARWCWRIALRGDGAWIGVLEPGHLRVYSANLSAAKIEPVQVQLAKPGDWALPRFLNDVGAGHDDVARRRYLTKLLDASAQACVHHGLSETDALSFVGRGLFWRFLLDRKLLSGLDPKAVSETANTWEECLDNKARALRTFRWLDSTFNGGLLPFETSPKDFDPAVFSKVLGNISHGAMETGQLRLPTDWKEVNFAYIPVGLLSEVYEAFAHHINSEEASSASIHYTPAHLVEMVVSQALAELPSGGKPRILDPATGAGVFLVTALRKLIEREWRESGDRPRRRRIREILHKQLVGFDIDTRALRLAELALYLTALDLDPEPHPLIALRFDELRENVLFDLSKVPNGSLAPVDERFRNKFDLVVGNPPWTAKKGVSTKTAWVNATREIITERLGQDRADSFDLPDTVTDVPFVWRATEWAKPGGRIALFMHARWLFSISDRWMQTRVDLLKALRITGILNGTALRQTKVWPRTGTAWSVLFATNEAPEPFDRAALQFMSPALEAQRGSQQSRVRIDWLDAETIPATEIVSQPSAFKYRFCGNRLATRAHETMQRVGCTFDSYLSELNVEFRNGYQYGGEEGTQRDSKHMMGMPDIQSTKGLGFVVNVRELPKFSRKTLLSPRPIGLYRAPLLLIRRAIPADRRNPYTHRVDSDAVFKATLDGVSFAGVKNGEAIAKYLQLVFQSSTYVFHELLVDAQYGMFVDAIYLESTRLLPLIPYEKLSEAQKIRARELSKGLSTPLSEEQIRDVDHFVLDTFRLPKAERQAVQDTIETGLPSPRETRRAVTPANPSERKVFVETLRDSLDRVLSASGLRAGVHERPDLRWTPWTVLELAISNDGASSATDPPMAQFLAEADATGASILTVRANKISWFVGVLGNYRYWTPTRARLLANDIIAGRST